MTYIRYPEESAVTPTAVIEALDGATIPTATVAGTDKVLIQDVNDSDNLKTVTAQSIADLAGSPIAAPVIQTFNLGSDQTVTNLFSNTAGGNFAQIGSVQVTVTITKTTDIVTINWNGSKSNTLYVGYQVDSDTPVMTLDASAAISQFNFTTTITGLAVGSRVIKLVGAKASASNVTIYSNNSTGVNKIPYPAKFTVTVFPS